MRTTRVSMAGLILALAAPVCASPQSLAAAPTGNHAAEGPGDKPAAVASALRFIVDDAPAALAEAKRRGVPIFVEAWAPW